MRNHTLAACASALLVFGWSCGDDDKSASDTDVSDADVDSDSDTDADTDVEYVATRLVPLQGCVAPEARRSHQMAWFRADRPVELTGVPYPVERGFLVLGGRGLNDEFLQDLWLYDLTNARPSACPWHLLNTSWQIGPGGIADASLTFDPIEQRFLLVGGHEDSANTPQASRQIAVLDLDDLDVGATFGTVSWLDPATYTTIEHSSPTCSNPPENPCFGWDEVNVSSCVVADSVPVDPCTGENLADFTDETTTPPCTDFNGISQSWAYEGCRQDPVCTRLGQGFETNWVPDPLDPLDSIIENVEVERTVGGLAQFAVLQDPASPSDLTLVGGTTGCEGTDRLCADSDWADLADADHHSHSPVLAIANPRAAYTIDGIVPTGPYTIDLGPWDLPPNPEPWPDAVSRGVRHSAGVFPGRTWNYVARAWEGTVEGDPFAAGLLFGGTRGQLIGPHSSNVVDLSNESVQGVEWHPCADDDWPVTSEWMGPEPQEWFSDQNSDGGVDDADAAVPAGNVATRFDGLDLVAFPVDGLPAGLYQSAAVAVQDDAVLLIGGRTFAEPEGAGQVWRVDLDHAPHAVTSAAVVSGPTPVRFGSAAVFDPIERRTYVFGGEVTGVGTEDCTNGLDDDGNTAVDCLDPSCEFDPACAAGLVYAIESPGDVVAPNDTSTFEIHAVDLEYEFVPKTGAEASIVDGTWVARLGFQFTHHCTSPNRAAVGSVDTWAADQCYADRVVLAFGDPDVDGPGANGLSELEGSYGENVRLELVLEDGTRVPMGPRLLEADGPGLELVRHDDDPLAFGRTDDGDGAVETQSWRLPVALVDGDSAALYVEWDDADPLDSDPGGVPKVLPTSPPARGARGPHLTLAYGAHHATFDEVVAPSCGERQVVVLRSLPLWMTGSPSLELDEDPLPLSSLHVVGPDGPLADPNNEWIEIGTGPAVPCDDDDFAGFPALATGGACFDALELPVRPACQSPNCKSADVGFAVYAAQGLVEVPVPDLPTVAVYADACFAPALMSSVQGHFDLGGAFASDVAQVEDWLGPHSIGSTSILLMPPGAGLTKFASTIPGSHVVTFFDSDGTAPDDPDGAGWLTAHDWRSVVIHEWMHVESGFRRSAASGTEWLIEAIPVIGATMLYPTGGKSDDRLHRGQSVLIANSRRNKPNGSPWPTDLELDGGKLATDYYIGPYTLSQMLSAASAVNPGLDDGEAALEQLADELFPAGELYEPLTVAQVETAVLNLGLVDFYAQWIAAGRLGTPVVGAVAVVAPNGAVTFSARQLQATRLEDPFGNAFPEVTEVAAYRACSSTTALTVPLADCDAAVSGLPVDRPQLVPGLGAAAGLDVAPALPARYALLAGPHLLPGHVGTYGISTGVHPVDDDANRVPAPTWWIACPAGSNDADCFPNAATGVSDADGDGWPRRVTPPAPAAASDIVGDCGDAAGSGSSKNPAVSEAAGTWSAVTQDTNCDGLPSMAFFVPSEFP